MEIHPGIRVFFVIALSLLYEGALPPLESAEPGTFRVGAAQIDITPSPESPVPMSGYGNRNEPFDAIHDRVYYRAIVMDDGNQKAAVLVGDVVGVSQEFWKRVTVRLAQQCAIPAANVMLCGTHTHGGPYPSYSESDAMLENIVSLTSSTIANLEPARVGAAKGYCNVNVSRRARTASGNDRGGWWLGQNPDGPADKTMHVVKFESLAGRPIAILANYAAHGTTMGQDNMELTSDHPGACCRYVEEHYGEDLVATWTSGAAGDLDPIYAYRENCGGRISPVRVLVRIQGEEVVRLTDVIETREPSLLVAKQIVITAPGQKNLSGMNFRPDGGYEFADAAPVDIRLTLLKLDSIALCGVSGEVLTLVGQRFKERAGLSDAVMVTHANGSSGYLPNDEAYERISYEILVTQVKPGVERLIIGGLLNLLGSTN